MIIQKFKCKTCDGTGGVGPLRIMTGKPFRPCIQCDGRGELIREVDETEEKMARMSEIRSRRK